jgi:hypothetical protein
MISDPPGAAPRIADEKSDKARNILMGYLDKSPWSCHFKIAVPGGNLEMDWRRIGSTAGYALWTWEARAVAATVLFTGHDPDDCMALERLAHAADASGPSLAPAFLKRLRESRRPLIGIAFGDVDSETRIPITEFSIGLSKGLCRQLTVKQSKPPLGTAIPQDFPPRFFHVVIVNGVIKRRLWLESKMFREIPNLQQAVTTFMDRFEDSFDKFDERILLRHDKGDRLLRVEWAGLRLTAGTAELTDSNQVHHTLLLLSGKDSAADDAVIDQFAPSLPHFVRGLFDVPLREVRTCPRPLLVELIGTEPSKLDPAAAPTAEALAVAFFRRLGVF